MIQRSNIRHAIMTLHKGRHLHLRRVVHLHINIITGRILPSSSSIRHCSSCSSRTTPSSHTLSVLVADDMV